MYLVKTANDRERLYVSTREDAGYAMRDMAKRSPGSVFVIHRGAVVMGARMDKVNGNVVELHERGII